MASGFRLEGNTSGNLAEVDGSNNLLVRLPSDPALGGFARIVGREDEQLRVTGTGYMMASIENLEFIDTVEGNSVNTSLWNQYSSGMTIVQGSGALSLNPTKVTTAGAYAIISSIQQFTNANTHPLYLRWSMLASNFLQVVGATMEAGWGAVATNATPTDGVFVRFTGGKAYLVINNNGTETVTEFTLPVSNVVSEFFMYVYGTRVKLFINNVRVLDVDVPDTYMAVTNSNRNPVFLRVCNGASAPASTEVLKLGQLTVQNLNSPLNKAHPDRLVGYGRTSLQSAVAPFGVTNNMPNSAAPASATLSNTAAGYSTLGGQFQYSAVAGSEVDYALFAYQVPAGFQLYLTDLNIYTFLTGQAIGNTPTILEWSLGLNDNVVSLANADGLGSWAARRLPVGIQSFLANAPVGTLGSPINTSFETPLVVDGGRFLHVILKIPTGLATGGQLFRGTVGLSGYLE